MHVMQVTTTSMGETEQQPSEIPLNIGIFWSYVAVMGLSVGLLLHTFKKTISHFCKKWAKAIKKVEEVLLAFALGSTKRCCKGIQRCVVRWQRRVAEKRKRAAAARQKRRAERARRKQELAALKKQKALEGKRLTAEEEAKLALLNGEEAVDEAEEMGEAEGLLGAALRQIERRAPTPPAQQKRAKAKQAANEQKRRRLEQQRESRKRRERKQMLERQKEEAKKKIGKSVVGGEEKGSAVVRGKTAGKTAKQRWKWVFTMLRIYGKLQVKEPVNWEYKKDRNEIDSEFDAVLEKKTRLLHKRAREQGMSEEQVKQAVLALEDQVEASRQQATAACVQQHLQILEEERKKYKCGVVTLATKIKSLQWGPLDAMAPNARKLVQSVLPKAFDRELLATIAVTITFKGAKGVRHVRYSPYFFLSGQPNASAPALLHAFKDEKELMGPLGQMQRVCNMVRNLALCVIELSLELHTKSQAKRVVAFSKKLEDPKENVSDGLTNSNDILAGEQVVILGTWLKSARFLQSRPAGSLTLDPLSLQLEGTTVVQGRMELELESTRSSAEASQVQAKGAAKLNQQAKALRKFYAAQQADK